MKISMYMIERWLKEYSPISVIFDGNPEIEGVCMFPSQGNLDTRYVYVSCNMDLFTDNDEIRILLTNRNDVIQLYTEDVFNQVLSVFEYYRNLEYRLTLAVHMEDGLQRIVDMCQEEFGPAYIIDQKYHILAISHAEKEGDYLDVWREHERTRLVSLDSLRVREDNLLYQSINKKVHNFTVQNKLTSPYCQEVMSSYCDEAGKVVGQCIIGFDRRIEAADYQLMDVFMSYLNSIDAHLPETNGNGLSEMILDALIHKQEVYPEDFLKVYDIQKWKADAALCVIVITREYGESETQMSRLHYMTNLQQNLYRYFPFSICVQEGERLVLCLEVYSKMQDNPYRYIPEKMMSRLQKKELRVGISYVFRDLSAFFPYYLQACEGISFCRDEKNWVYFGECALRTRLCGGDVSFVRPHLHPLIQRLYDADKENHTVFGETLRQYLRYERSYVETARQMGVHRNTIVYRIERIKELYPALNLDDPDEREYLIYSFRLYVCRD